jgi:hypothetical protein
MTGSETLAAKEGRFGKTHGDLPIYVYRSPRARSSIAMSARKSPNGAWHEDVVAFLEKFVSLIGEVISLFRLMRSRKGDSGCSNEKGIEWVNRSRLSELL